ncbi:MAG: MBL fold metallo-hydrolase [Gammaproteobacteria bacterium]
MATVLRIAPSVRLGLVAERRSGTYLGEVDCRLLFLGDRYRRLARAYQEIVHRFDKGDESDRLFDELCASAEIRQFYEIRRERDTVSVTLREMVFRTPGSLDNIELELKVSRRDHTFFHPLPLDRLRTLGRLLPLLAGDRSEAAIRSILDAHGGSGDARWALGLLSSLDSHGCLQRGQPSTNVFLASGSRPRVTLIGHSAILFQSRESAVVVDPILRRELGHSPRALDVARLRLGGICCSHAHWDHCDLQTLLWFDKATPVFVPRVRRVSAFNAPMVGALERLGFTNVREVEPWQTIAIDDIELIPVPFYGEQDEPGSEIDHYTYVLRTAGLTVYGGVDSFRDTFGDMTPVLERVKCVYRPDVAFLPVSRMVFTYRGGGVNAFCRYLDRGLLGRSFQYTAGPEQAAAWAAVLDARWIVPYATFTFPRRDAPEGVARFASALRSMGLGRRLYPLRPLDALPALGRRRDPRSEIRRWTAVAWYRVWTCLRHLHLHLSARLDHRVIRRIPRAFRREFDPCRREK